MITLSKNTNNENNDTGEDLQSFWLEVIIQKMILHHILTENKNKSKQE